ncbi:MAG: penicillin-binding protein 1A [Maribacter sp.]|jgi:penicillin-binding protein 1A
MNNNEYREQHMPAYKKRIRQMWILWGLGVLGMLMFFIVLSFSGDLPSTKELQDPQNNLATEVIAAEGTVIGRYFVENRVKVNYGELPENLVNALIATEDKRYRNHAGIDLEALGRVVKGLALGTTDQGGGSTITQQLAKMQYSNRAFSGNKVKKAFNLVLTKFKEWITAVQLERRYTKEEIISMYLNEFDFLYGAVGIKSAAETYFGKSPDSLKMEESAMLVGMLKNPSLYNPKKFPENAKKRREVVLKLTMNNRHFDRETYDSLRNEPINLSFSRKTHSEGIAPYFREELRSEVKKILASDEMMKADGTKYNVHTDGLRIYTTIDPRMQEYAEASVSKNMAINQKKFFKEWKDKDPWTYGNLTKKQKEIRQNSFTKVLRETDRYHAHRAKYLGDALSTVNDVFKFLPRDYDIERMLKEEKESGHLAKLVKKNLLTKDKSLLYRKVMKSDAWITLKSQWRKLEKAARRDFDTKTKMRIFAYNDEMEVDTLMTPRDSLRYIRMQLQTGVMAVDPRTGAIKAWVGGINHKYFKFDHVNINVERQVGSTFKPFVYATAIEQWGISPCYKVADIPYTIHPGEGCFGLLKPWTPKNFGEYTGEEFSLYKGLEKSKNTVSTYLMKQIGCPEPVRLLAERMGIDVNRENVYGQPRVPKQPSICLGATDLSVYEMTGAYATFANRGFYQKPYFIDRIEDRNGVVIYKNVREKRPPALPADANYVMIDMLKRVAKPIQWKLKSQVAGKTGTTNNAADAWFMGFTPELVIGTWVGGDDRWIRFRNPSIGQGGVLARPIFVDMLKAIEEDSLIQNYNPKATFKRPPGELSIRIDCSGIYGNPEDMGGLTDDPNASSNGGEFGDEFDSEEESSDDSFGDIIDGDSSPPSVPKPNPDAVIIDDDDDSEGF